MKSKKQAVVRKPTKTIADSRRVRFGTRHRYCARVQHSRSSPLVSSVLQDRLGSFSTDSAGVEFQFSADANVIRQKVIR